MNLRVFIIFTLSACILFALLFWIMMWKQKKQISNNSLYCILWLIDPFVLISLLFMFRYFLEKKQMTRISLIFILGFITLFIIAYILIWIYDTYLCRIATLLNKEKKRIPIFMLCMTSSSISLLWESLIICLLIVMH